MALSMSTLTHAHFFYKLWIHRPCHRCRWIWYGQVLIRWQSLLDLVPLQPCTLPSTGRWESTQSLSSLLSLPSLASTQRR